MEKSKPVHSFCFHFFENGKSQHTRLMNDSIMSSARKVCFATSEDKVYLVESWVDFSEQEIQQAWYSQAEIKTIRCQCYQDAARLRQKIDRGLECLTKQALKSLRANVQACIDAVMGEQDSQWESEHDDHDRFAMVSLQVTQQSTRIAIELANEDAKAAREVYKQVLNVSCDISPMMPKRQDSSDNLCSTTHQDAVPSNLLEGPEKTTNDFAMCVDLGTRPRLRNEIVPMVYSASSCTTFRSQVA